MMECSKYLLGTTYQPGGAMLYINCVLGLEYKVIFLPENIIISDNGMKKVSYQPKIRELRRDELH
jgi:hypothetical protein